MHREYLKGYFLLSFHILLNKHSILEFPMREMNKTKYSDFSPCSDHHNSHFNAYFQLIFDVYNLQSFCIYF